jgi:hypothetical protein
MPTVRRPVPSPQWKRTGREEKNAGAEFPLPNAPQLGVGHVVPGTRKLVTRTGSANCRGTPWVAHRIPSGHRPAGHGPGGPPKGMKTFVEQAILPAGLLSGGRAPSGHSQDWLPHKAASRNQKNIHHRDTEENKVKTGGHRGGRGHGGAILLGISVSVASVRENRRGLRGFGPLVVQSAHDRVSTVPYVYGSLVATQRGHRFHARGAHRR